MGTITILAGNKANKAAQSALSYPPQSSNHTAGSKMNTGGQLPAGEAAKSRLEPIPPSLPEKSAYGQFLGALYGNALCM